MSNRDYIEKAIACFGDSSRREEYLDLYSDDAVVHGYQGIGPGKANIERFYGDFWSVFPDARVELQEVAEQGDSAAIRYVIIGTQDQAFLGNPSTGHTIQLAGISSLHFKMVSVSNAGPALTPCRCSVSFVEPVARDQNPPQKRITEENATSQDLSVCWSLRIH